jgi:hypothetical protein
VENVLKLGQCQSLSFYQAIKDSNFA